MRKYYIRNEYGETISGSKGSYDMTCRIAHFMREFGVCDYFVVSSNTSRASSEVFDYNDDLDKFARDRAHKLCKEMV